MKRIWLLLLTVAIASACCSSATAAAAADPERFHESFSRPVVVIDVGHGGIDGGTSYQGLLEKNINLEIGKKLYMILRSNGVAAVLNRTGDYALSDENRWLRNPSRHRRDLAQRRQLTEELPTELFVSLHVNWSKRPAYRGPLVLHQDEGRSFLLATLLQQSLNGLYGTNKQVQHGKTFYLLRRVKQPAVIVETGYISNSGDREKLCSSRGQKEIAQAIYAAIQHYLQLT